VAEEDSNRVLIIRLVIC